MCCSLNKFSQHFFGGRLARSASPRRKGGGGSLFLTNRRKRPSPFSPLLQIGTQLHVGATARQGRLRERECVVGLFFISRGGGEGQQGPRPLTPENQKNPFSKKKHFFNFRSALSSTSATAPSSPASPSQNASTPRGSRRSGRRPTSTTSGGRSRCCGGCAARSTSWRWRARSRTRTLPTS